MKMIINAGIAKVFYVDGYPDELSHELIIESGILVQKVDNDEHLSSNEGGQRSTFVVRSVNSKLKTQNLKLRSKKA
jgi:dCMP deaminase